MHAPPSLVLMASLLLLLVIFFSCSLFSSFNSPQIPIPQHIDSKSSCNAAHNGQRSSNHFNAHETLLGKFTRKNLNLLGFEGLFGATNLFSNRLNCDGIVDGPAGAKPTEPDFWNCNQTRFPPSGVAPESCCPPSGASRKIIDFKLVPPAQTGATMRIRRPFHTLDEEYIAKYRKGIEIMKALPDEDPRSFKNQANIHCTYCEGQYTQVGFPHIMHMIHHSWLFFPFHRCYLYFFEKIMGDLIGDPNFALPFWNWDTPAGMAMPSIFTEDPNSPLYDRFRDVRHLPPALIDFAYDDANPTQSPVRNHDEQVGINLAVMYKSMVSGAKTASLFMGSPYVAGQQGEPGGGLVETLSHDLGHAWVGNLTGEDMGIYYSAARDPVFYLHHSNLDRMWSLWKSLPNGGKEFADTAWLDSSFLFYNEKQELIRVKVRDVLDAEKLGYRYEDVQLPWLEKRPNRTRNSTFKDARRIKKFGAQTANDADAKWAMDVFPRRLDKVIKVIVARPKKSRSVEEKEAEEEILVIEGIEANPEAFVKFDVLINYEDDLNSVYADRAEFAGSFVRLRKKHRHNSMTETSQMFGISELLEDLGAEDEDRVQITLVPRSKLGDVFIGGIKIVVESRS